MLQTCHSPIIVGERYELAETLSHGGENGDGLLAKSDYQTALLSMSGYDRHAASDVNGMFVVTVYKSPAAMLLTQPRVSCETAFH